MSSFYRYFMGVLILPLKLTVKNPRFVYFQAVLEIPCTFFFLKALSPTTAKQVLGPSHQKYLGWWQGGESAKISTHASQGLRLETLSCTFCHWCRKNVPRNGQRHFACDKATQTEQSSSWAGWKRRREGKPAPDCSACKAPRGWEDGEYQKIVVSYLVLIPLLASCPGSTIHGRLARVFCSDGSICFKRERLMPVMWYLYGGSGMHPNAAWRPTRCPDRTSEMLVVRIICSLF